MPFPYVSRFITRFFDIIGESFNVVRKRHPVFITAGVRRVFPGLEYRPARSAYRLRSEGVVELDAFAREGVKVGSYVKGLSETAAGIASLLVGEIENYIFFHFVFFPSLLFRTFQSLKENSVLTKGSLNCFYGFYFSFSLNIGLVIINIF